MQYLFRGNINPRIQNKTSRERWTRSALESLEKQWTTLRNELTFVVQFHDQMNKLPFNRLITDQIHKQQLVGQQKLSLVFPNSCKYFFMLKVEFRVSCRRKKWGSDTTDSQDSVSTGLVMS